MSRVRSDDLVLVVRILDSSGLSGSVAPAGSQSPREFEGWIEFIGTVTDLKEEAFGPRSGRAVDGRPRRSPAE